MSRCFFKSFAPDGLRECDGPMHQHHWVKRQTIRGLFPRPTLYATDEEVQQRKRRLNAALKDPRNLVSVCRRHHELHERAKRIPVPREGLPYELEEFAEEFGLQWALDTQFGVRTEAACRRSTGQLRSCRSRKRGIPESER